MRVQCTHCGAHSDHGVPRCAVCGHAEIETISWHAPLPAPKLRLRPVPTTGIRVR